MTHPAAGIFFSKRLAPRTPAVTSMSSMFRRGRPALRSLSALAAAVAVCALTACGGTPGPTPSQRIGEELDRVFAVVEGEEAVRAVLVAQHGVPIFEEYRDSAGDDAWDVREITATVTTTLVGIAIDEGLIPGVDATLGELLPAERGTMTPETAALTLHAVMTHTAGFPSRGADADPAGAPSWVSAILVDRSARGPGDGSYGDSDEGAHILAAVLAEATGMTPLEYARLRLFDPLGIDADADGVWPSDPAGINLGGEGLRLRPSDLMLLGQLFLDRGRSGDRVVVSADWISQATWPIVETRSALTPFVGYGWGVNDEAGVFLTRGVGGTVLVVHPQKKVVVVLSSEIAPDDARGTWGVMTVSVLALAMALISEVPLG